MPLLNENRAEGLIGHISSITQKWLQSFAKGYRENPYLLTDVVCELEILKEKFKLLEYKHLLVLFKNLYGSNQTLQAEMNGFKGQTREDGFTNKERELPHSTKAAIMPEFKDESTSSSSGRGLRAALHHSALAGTQATRVSLSRSESHTWKEPKDRSRLMEISDPDGSQRLLLSHRQTKQKYFWRKEQSAGSSQKAANSRERVLPCE